MKSHSLINFHATFGTLCALMLGLFVTHAKADQWDKKTILTVDQPIQVQEKVLEPGQYVFKLHESNSDRHIVQIFNGDQTQIIDTVMAIPNYRLRPTGKSQFAFWETPPGTAKALRAWFYPGDNSGQEFRYPKHLEMLASAATAVQSRPETTVTEPPRQEPTPQEPAVQEPARPEAQPQSMTQMPREEPVEIAQNANPQTPEPLTHEESHEARPKELPKSGSMFPLFGFAGLLSLGLYGLLRLKWFVQS